MDISKYYIDLITQEPINYNGLIIYQPSFKEINKVGLELYNQIMMVYSLTTDCFSNLPNKEDINLFEDVIINDDYLLSCLSESLCLLTKVDEIVLFKQSKTLQLRFIDTKKEIVEKEIQKEEEIIEPNSLKLLIKKWIFKLLGKEIKPKTQIITKTITEEVETKSDRFFIIDSNNFNDLSDIVLKINAKKKLEIEKPPANMSPRQRDIWEKLQEGRRNDAKKNEIHIYDILNICEYCGSHISIGEIVEWSLWRIMNCYKSRIDMKSYDDNLQIALVSGDGKIISGNNHWHYQLMIRE